MGFFKIFESELNSIVQIVTGSNASTKSRVTETETEKLQGMLNNIKGTEQVFDVTQKKPVSERVNEREVQDAIKYFNSLSPECRNDIMEKADAKLQEKLMAFMDENAKYTENIDTTYYLINRLVDACCVIARRKSYTEKEMSVLVKDFQKLVAKCNIEADRVIKAFTAYRGEDCANCGKICENNKDEYAISTSSRFKQAMSSYNQLFVSNIQEILKSSESSKLDFMHNLQRTVTRLCNEIEHYQSESRQQMNSFIPDVVLEENRFSRNANNYVEKGIPTDLCLQNKVVENVIIDSLLEAVQQASISDAA